MIIYGIKIDNKIVYVGSTKNTLARRKSEHMYKLRINKHHNYNLQLEYNNDKKLTFHVLDTASSLEDLLIKEKHYINLYGDYNIELEPGGRAMCNQEVAKKSANTRRKWTKDDLKKVLIDVIELGLTVTEACEYSPLTIIAFNDTVMQGGNTSILDDELIELIEKYERRNWFDVVDKNNNIYTVKNISVFAKDNNLSVGSLRSLKDEKIKFLNGWRLLKNMHLSEPKIYFISPTNEEIELTTTLTEFASIYNLSRTALSMLKLGKAKSHKGWTISIR